VARSVLYTSTMRTTRDVRRSRAVAIALVLSGALPACGGTGDPGPFVVSPQPIPVSDAVPELSVSDLEVVRTASATELEGGHGAATPAQSRVLAFAIDAPGVSAQATSGKDGTFVASLAAPHASAFHLEVEFENQVSMPFDLTWASGKLTPLPSPLCLTNDVLEPLIEQGPAGKPSTFLVKLTEKCGVKRDLQVRLHDGSRFELTSAPTSIAAHASLTVSVFHPAAHSAGEDVDLLVVNDGEPGSMVVSLHAVTP
jgi:hypothetical protein